MLPTLKKLKDARSKRILMRVDFNIPIIQGKIEDDFRIKKTLPTIKFLSRQGAKIILISHLTEGRAKSLKPMAKYLGIKFISGNDISLIRKKIDNLKNGDIILLENIRSFKGEEDNDKNFTADLAGLGDVYINEAFSASHRKHSSIVGLPKFLPSYMGFLFEEELKNLSAVFHPTHPFLFILGGAKFETKINLVKNFLKIADKIFIGGALAAKAMENRLFFQNPKIIFPVGDPRALDANDETLKNLEKEVGRAKFILWNGPLGDYEKGFSRGTLSLARMIANSRARSVIGGGDTVAVVKKVGLNKFSFVSTGGGAMLEFLAKGTLPGIEVLKKYA